MMSEPVAKKRSLPIVLLAIAVAALLVVGYQWSGREAPPAPSETAVPALDPGIPPESVPFTSCGEGCTHSL